MQPSRAYFFVTYNTSPGIYELDDKKYNEQEYTALCEKILLRNKNSVIWNEGKSYDNENKIIVINVLDSNPENMNKNISAHIIIALFIGFSLVSLVYFLVRDYKSSARNFGIAAVLVMVGLISNKFLNIKNEKRKSTQKLRRKG